MSAPTLRSARRRWTHFGCDGYAQITRSLVMNAPLPELGERGRFSWL